MAARRRAVGLAIASLCFLAPLLLLPYARAAQPQAWQLLGLRGETVLALHVANYDNQRLVYAETRTGLWRFSPGTDWQRIDGPLPRSPLGGPALAAWHVVTGRPRQIYALTGTGTARQLFRSDTGGDNWQIIGPAPGQTARPPMLALSGLGDAPDTVTLVTDSRMQRSTDGGATWSPGGPWPLENLPPGRSLPIVTALMGDSSAPEHLYALTENGLLWASDSSGLAWHIIETPAITGPVSAIAIMSYFSIRVWAATPTQLVHSADSDATWNSHSLPSVPQILPVMARTGHITALLVDPRNPETLYAANAGGRIFRSDDSGDRWTDLGTPGGARAISLAVDLDTRGQLFAATNDGIWTLRVSPPTPTTLSGDELAPAALDDVLPTDSPSGTSSGKDATLDNVKKERNTATATPSATETATSTATVTPSPLPTSTDTPAPPPSATARPSPAPSPTWAPTDTLTVVPPTAPPTLPPPPPPTAAPARPATALPTVAPAPPPTSAPPTVVPPR